MNVDELLKAIDELNDADLEYFIEGALRVRASRRVGIQSPGVRS